jgi:biotin transport system substrate-specific component
MQTLTLEKNPAKDLCLILLAAFAISFSGALAIPLWFTPIPLAIRPAVILLSAALLGSKRGSIATFLFLLQGACGLPVFSNGASGLHHFWGPQGGYLIGYLVASYLIGLMIEKGKSSLAAFSVGNLTIYLLGAGYLSTFVGFTKALLLGVVPFLLGDLLKMVVSVKLFHRIRR